MMSFNVTSTMQNRRAYLRRCLRCFFGIPWIVLLSPWSRDKRILLKGVSASLGWEYPAAVVPRCSVGAFWPSNRSPRILEPEHADGNVSLTELICIDGLVVSHQPMRIFEIGTFDGRTSLNMIANAPPEARLWTLDLPSSGVEDTVFRLDEGEKTFVRKRESGARFAAGPYRDRIVQLYGDSAKYEPGELRGTMDLVFVDGSHSLNYVLSDTELALRLARSGAIVIWHDYDGVWPGVTMGLNRVYREDRRIEDMWVIERTTLVFGRVR